MTFDTAVCTGISITVNIDYCRCMIPLDVTDVSAACCTPLVRETLSPDDAEQLAHTMKALADPTRLRLLSIVAASEGAEACVCDLIDPVGLSQPTVSHHLKVLTEAGFLTRSKRGTWAYYALVPGALDRVSRLFVAS